MSCITLTVIIMEPKKKSLLFLGCRLVQLRLAHAIEFFILSPPSVGTLEVDHPTTS